MEFIIDLSYQEFGNEVLVVPCFSELFSLILFGIEGVIEMSIIRSVPSLFLGLTLIYDFSLFASAFLL